MATKSRLADRLVVLGICASRHDAERRVLAGQVYVDGQRADKPGAAVSQTALVTAKGGSEPFASRGGRKLERALQEFALSVVGRSVLDAGASAGGFTDCLLHYGAARVYAADVGYGQMRGRLANDPRVVNLERTNIGDLARESFAVPIDLATVDLSYLSLTKALPILAKLFTGPPAMVALIKPLFEGVATRHMADAAAIHEAVLTVAAKLEPSGLYISKITDSPVLGTSGTIELLALVGTEREVNMPSALAAALARAARLTLAE